jgi:hypothetical protein
MAVTINASTSSGLVQTADTSGTINIQSNGTTQFTVDSTGAYGQLERGTAVASTSGTSIDFTSIPSWVKRITVMFSAVSTSGTSIVQVQLGAGSVTTSGYTSGSMYSTTTYTSTTGLALPFAAAVDSRYGSMVITNLSGNLWNASNAIYTTGPAAGCGGGSITLGGTLDRIRITTVNGTDTFDAGTINILYEG